MTQARRTGLALERMYQFLLWLVPAVEKFPRRQKFLLGDRSRNSQRIGEHFQSPTYLIFLATPFSLYLSKTPVG